MLDLSLILILVLIACGTAWLAKDLPSVLRDIWQLIGDWAAVHDVSRRVDCRPWGFDRTFVISMDLATTAPAEAPLCSWAAVPGRKWEFGLSLWNGAVALSRRLVEQRAELRAGAFADGRTVVELGCGQALVSMVVAALFPGLRRILATDGSEDVLHCAEANISANLGADPGALRLAPLRWGDAEDLQRALADNDGSAYDVVLGADVTYTEDCSDLVSAIFALSHGSTEVWLAHEPRRHPVDELEARLEAGFRSVEKFEMRLTPEETGRNETVPIIGWHCIGKVEL